MKGQYFISIHRRYIIGMWIVPETPVNVLNWKFNDQLKRECCVLRIAAVSEIVKFELRKEVATLHSRHPRCIITVGLVFLLQAAPTPFYSFRPLFTVEDWMIVILQRWLLCLSWWLDIIIIQKKTPWKFLTFHSQGMLVEGFVDYAIIDPKKSWYDGSSYWSEGKLYRPYSLPSTSSSLLSLTLQLSAMQIGWL